MTHLCMERRTSAIPKLVPFRQINNGNKFNFNDAEINLGRNYQVVKRGEYFVTTSSTWNERQRNLLNVNERYLSLGISISFYHVVKHWETRTMGAEEDATIDKTKLKISSLIGENNSY